MMAIRYTDERLAEFEKALGKKYLKQFITIGRTNMK